ncbi:MAG: hypothetical protein AB7G93_16415 [Bdellovibrionales bacterium]
MSEVWRWVTGWHLPKLCFRRRPMGKFGNENAFHRFALRGAGLAATEGLRDRADAERYVRAIRILCAAGDYDGRLGDDPPEDLGEFFRRYDRWLEHLENRINEQFPT